MSRHCHRVSAPKAAPRYDTVLLDLDGTLTDSAPGIRDALTYMASRLGIIITPEQQQAMIGPPFRDTFPRVLGLDVEATRHGVVFYRERYREVILTMNSVYAGIPELLAELTGAGCALALATTKPLRTATLVVEHFGLARHFTVLGGASFDGRVDTKAQVIGSVLDQLPDPGRIVMVGDRAQDVLGAAAYRIGCIGAGWGYGSQAELTTAGAVAYARTVEELRALLV